MLQNITQIQESAQRDRCPCSTNPPLFSSPWVARRPGHPDLLGGRTLLGADRGGLGWVAGEALIFLRGLAGEELAHGRYQRLDALAQALVALARALVRRTGLFGQGLYPRAKAVVHLCDLDGQLAQVHGDFVNVALRAAPQAAEFLAVFAAFLREACGDMLDAFEAFFGGHGFLQYSANCSTAIRPGFQKNPDRTAQPSMRAHCPFSKPAARPALPWSIENKGVIIIGFAQRKNSERTAQPLLPAHFHPRIRPPAAQMA